MEYAAVILLVHNDPVDDHQGLGIGIQGVDAVHHHVVPDARCAAARNGAHVCPELVPDFRRDVQRRAVSEVVRLHRVHDVVIRAILRPRHGGIQDDIAQQTGFVDAHAHRVMVGCGDLQGRSILGHLELVSAVFARQRTVALITAHTDQRARQRRSG